jgi:hypothetical protein
MLKMGAGITLLLWSFSEIFNNEISGKHIWNVSTPNLNALRVPC